MESPKIHYIRIPQDSELDIDGVRIDPRHPLPVLVMPGEKVPTGGEDVSKAQIAAGMIEVIAHEPENPEFEYYKSVVLGSDRDMLKSLKTGAAAKIQEGQNEFAIDLVLAIKNIEPTEDKYVLLAGLYAGLAAKYLKSGEEEKGSYYDDKTMNILKEGLEKFPESGQLMIELGSFHMRQGNWENAKDYLNKFLEKYPEDEKAASAKKILALADENLKNEEEMLSIHDDIVMDRPEEAVRKADALIEKLPGLWQLYMLKGWALRTMERYDEGRKALLEALNKGGGDYSEVYNELSLCEYECGEKGLAKEYMAIAAEKSDKEITFPCNLASMHMEDGEWEEMLHCLIDARKIDREDPILLDLIRRYEEGSGEKFPSDEVADQL